MASENFLALISELNIKESDSQQTLNRFLVFDFAALRCIRFVNNDMLCDASRTLREFISGVRTKHVFLANHHNCVTHSIHFLHKQLFYLCRNIDEVNEKVVVELMDLFNELCDGLLYKQQLEPKIIYPTDGSFALLDLLLESDYDVNIKLQCYKLVELLLNLVFTKKASVEDKPILSRIISKAFVQIVDDDVVLLKHLCCVATIYLKGVKVGIFEKTDLVDSWIVVECINWISKDTDEAVLLEIIRCVSALCKITKKRISNLIKKLDILISLSGNKLFNTHDVVIIISQAVKEACKENSIILPFETFLENEITQIIQQRINTNTNDLVFVIFYLQLKYSSLTLSVVQLKRLICTKLDENTRLSSGVLKAISSLFPIAFNESDSNFKQYSFMLFEALCTDDLETIISYEKAQFYWIMNNSNRALKWKVLQLWIKNYNHDESDLILEVICECKCGYLLPDFLKTDNSQKVARIIKSLNDPDLFRILCELIPNHLNQVEAIETIINAGAAVPATEEFAAVYLTYFLNMINNKLYKNGLTAILQYVVSIAKQYKSSEIVAFVVCNPKLVQGVLNAVYDDFEESLAWDSAVTLLYIAMVLQIEHGIEIKNPVEVDILKFASNSTNKNCTHKYNTMVKLTKHILTTPNSSNMLKFPGETNLEIVKFLLNSPDDADLTSVLKVLIRLLQDNPNLAFLPTINCYISFNCKTIKVTDTHLTVFIRFLRRFLMLRQNDPWSICVQTKKSLMVFYNKLKSLQNVQFVFQYFKNSQENDFARDILNKIAF